MAPRLALVAGTLALAVVAGTLLLRPRGVTPDPALSSRLERTEARLAGMQRSLAASRPARTQPASSPLGVHATTETTAAAEAPRGPQPEIDVVADLEDTLELEGTDPSWSRMAERDLQSAYDSPEIDGSRVDAVRCGATVCRMNVTHDDDDATLEFRAHVARLNPFPKSSVLVQQRTDSRSQISSIVFVARSEHGLVRPH